MAHKIYNVFTPEQQQERMWRNRRVIQEGGDVDFRSIRHHLLRILSGDKSKVVLEAGCGLGAWVIYLRNLGYHHTHGVDNNCAVLRAVKQYDPSAPIFEGDICRLPFPNDSVDVYISLGVLEHFIDGPWDALAEARRVLKPGGLLFVTVPLNNLMRRVVTNPLRGLYLDLGARLRGRPLYFIEYRYSRNKIVEIIQKAGFKTELVDYDDYESKDESLGLYTDFPFLRGGVSSREMTACGRLAARLCKAVSPWLATAGVLVIGSKTG
jgi:SAM-dependent methyltransferase